MTAAASIRYVNGQFAGRSPTPWCKLGNRLHQGDARRYWVEAVDEHAVPDAAAKGVAFGDPMPVDDPCQENFGSLGVHWRGCVEQPRAAYDPSFGSCWLAHWSASPMAACWEPCSAGLVSLGVWWEPSTA